MRRHLGAGREHPVDEAGRRHAAKLTGPAERQPAGAEAVEDTLTGLGRTARASSPRILVFSSGGAEIPAPA